jgi:hypothetical protein
VIFSGFICRLHRLANRLRLYVTGISTDIGWRSALQKVADLSRQRRFDWKQLEAGGVFTCLSFQEISKNPVSI